MNAVTTLMAVVKFVQTPLVLTDVAVTPATDLAQIDTLAMVFHISVWYTDILTFAYKMLPQHSDST